MSAEITRRRAIQIGVGFAASLLIPGCNSHESRPRPQTQEQPKQQETELPGKHYLIISRYDNHVGAHESESRVEAINPQTGEVAATLATGSTIVCFAPGGRYIGLGTAIDESYGGWEGETPTTLRVFDAALGLTEPVISKTFNPRQDGHAVNLRSAAVDDSGNVILAYQNETGVLKLSPNGPPEGTKVTSQELDLNRIDVPPQFVPDSNELVVVRAQADGISLQFYSGESYSQSVTEINNEKKRMPKTMRLFGAELAAVGAWNNSDGHHAVLINRTMQADALQLNSVYLPVFSPGGIVAASATEPGQSSKVVKTGLCVFDPQTMREQRIQGLADPLWFNERTILARELDTGAVHRIDISDDGKLKTPEKLAYALSDDHVTIRGMAG